MTHLNPLKSVDIYLLDQAFKGRIPERGRMLDAGCGGGRNFSWLAEQNVDITGVDPDQEKIDALKTKHPSYSSKLFCVSIEAFKSTEQFDVIICNAVLHFAKDHRAFDQQFEALVHLLEPGGMLFVRMTCSMGLNLSPDENGRCVLPDLTERYILTPEKLQETMTRHELTFLEPIKTVWVNGERSMAVLVLTK